MHHYRHHIGDYRSDTQHLSLLEHGVYRQALDQYYLSEQPLPLDMKRLMRLLCVRNADEERALCDVLEEFFTKTDDGYVHKRAEQELSEIYDKSEKARKSAKARWDKENQGVKGSDANAMRTQCESDANGMLPSNPLPINPNTPPNPPKGGKRFKPPDVDEVEAYCRERGNTVDPQQWHDHYTANGWKVGKNPMKDWRAAVRTWEKNANETRQRSAGEPRIGAAERSRRAIAEQRRREAGG